MKTTTNQTRNFCRTNIYFRMYVEMYERRLSYKQMPDGWTDYNTNFKNQLFRRAWKEFDQKFKGLRTQSGRRSSGNFSSSVRINMSLCTWAEFAEFRYSCSMNNKGDWWIFIDHSSLIDYFGEYHSRVDGKFLFTDSENPFERSLQYNGNLSIDVVDEFVKNYIERTLLYPKGYFRNIQENKQCSKERAKWYYKIWQQREREKISQTYHDENELIYKWIKRNFNIESNEYIGIDRTISFVNKRGRYNKLVVLETFNYSYEGDGDIDELESDFNEYMDSFEKNTVFV